MRSRPPLADRPTRSRLYRGQATPGGSLLRRDPDSRRLDDRKWSIPIGDAETGKTSTLRGIGRQIVESKASDEPSTGR